MSNRAIKAVVKHKLSMTKRENLVLTQTTLRKVLDAKIPGAIVECGTWRGGHALIAAEELHERGELRYVWVFDTFSGMTEPSSVDVKANMTTEEVQAKFATGGWCAASLDEVRSAFKKHCNYSMKMIKFVEGDVRKTMKENMPAVIAWARLDTDFYDSTVAELEAIWPRLQPGGVLIFDDYGRWEGQRKAVDEFFSAGRDVRQCGSTLADGKIKTLAVERI